ncbi:MAG: DUF5317 domain-containing protein [Firmicutes bacterium]|nr:DUF5317 domain-containing protein [Bacillota bacterium]
MFFSVIILSILIASLRGGRISRFADAEFSRLGWIILSFAVRFALSVAGGRVSIPPAVASIVHLSAYGMVIFAVASNLRMRGMWSIGAGTALNLAVIAANGGRMPIGLEGLRRAGLDSLPSFRAIASGLSYTHELVDEGTRLAFLGDVLSIPKPLWPPTVFSAGDVLVMLGAFVLVQSVMVPQGAGTRR